MSPYDMVHVMMMARGQGATKVKIGADDSLEVEFSPVAAPVEPAPMRYDQAPPAAEEVDEPAEGDSAPDETPEQRRERERKARLVPDHINPDVLFGGAS